MMIDTAQPAPLSATMRSLLVLAWPIVFARATQAVVGFSDALMSAPLGSETLAAVTTGALDTWGFAMLPMGTVFIVQSFAAQLYGRRDLHAARRYAYYGMIIAAAAGVLSALAIPFVPGLIALLGYAPRVQAQMSEYMMIRLLSVGAFVAAEALGNWYGGLNNTRLALLAGVVTMVANVSGNYALIEPRFGLPGYGAPGAAWASVIASWLGFAVIAAAFALRYGFPDELKKDAGAASQKLGLHASELWRVLRFGLPNGVNYFLEFAAFALFINVVVGGLGTHVLAAMNVVLNINSISFMPAFGMASAGAILVGNAIGAGDKDDVPSILRRSMLVTVGWMGSVGLVYWFAPVLLMGMFEPGDAGSSDLLEVGATMLALSALWQVFDAASITLSEALRAAGDTTFCMNARIVLAWFVFIPAAWYAVRVLNGGVVAIMWSLIAYIALLAGTLALRFASGKWRQIDLLGSGEPAI
jgi:multidrug resistance protein, MATE family